MRERRIELPERPSDDWIVASVARALMGEREMTFPSKMRWVYQATPNAAYPDGTLISADFLNLTNAKVWNACVRLHIPFSKRIVGRRSGGRRWGSRYLFDGVVIHARDFDKLMLELFPREFIAQHVQPVYDNDDH